MAITRDVEVKVTPTPEEVAEAFCAFDSRQMAEVFNHIEVSSNKWASSFCYQMQYVTDNGILTNGGRHIMKTIGEYSDSEYYKESANA